MEPSGSPVSTGSGGRKKSVPPPLSSTPGYPSTSAAGHMAYNPAASPPVTPRYPPTTQQPFMSPQQTYGNNPSNTFQPPPPRRGSYQQYPQHAHQTSQSYNPAQHQYNPASPPAHQQFFSPPPAQHQHQQPWGQPPQQQQQNQWGQNVPQGYVPPPPPPGPPPQQQSDFAHFSAPYPGGQGGYAQSGRPLQGGQQQQQKQQQGNDPWAGLSGWK